jgi:hypothetical protein
LADREALLSLAEPPEWLRKCIASARRSAPHTSTPEPKKWVPGERNNKLTSVAGSLRRRGLTLAAIEAALLEENRQRSVPPLEDTEVRNIARSIARYPAGAEASEHRPEGFVPPGYDDSFSALLDVIRFTADLPEFLVLLFHVERSLGYGKAADCVSISQTVDGVYSCKFKTWIRKGCGLSKASVARAIRSLVAPDLPYY